MKRAEEKARSCVCTLTLVLCGTTYPVVLKTAVEVEGFFV